MGIVEMRKLEISATKKNRKKILEFLQKIGAVEIDSLDVSDTAFEKMDTSGQRIRFQKIADDFDHVIEYLKKYDKSKSGSLLNLENTLISRGEYDDIVKNARNALIMGITIFFLCMPSQIRSCTLSNKMHPFPRLVTARHGFAASGL